MKFEIIQEPSEPPMHGPFWQIPEDHHEWELSVHNECGSVSMSLVCRNPCGIPYDPHTGRVCSCEWVVAQDVDFFAESIPIKLVITQGHRDSYTGEWEAPIVEGVPR